MAAKVTGKTRCVIISGAPEFDAEFIKTAVKNSDYVICADSGLTAAEKAGVTPDLIVGDFDSYTDSVPNDCEVIRLSVDKDDTDTLHCVKVALDRGFRDFALLAATGSRLDHTLANLSILEFFGENGATGVILSENETVCFICKGEHRFDGNKGKTFSVLPFGCESVTLSYSGAKYPLVNGTLKHSVAMGISNVFVEDKAAITVHEGRALVIIDAGCWKPVSCFS